MKDINVYTTALFSVGMYALCGFIIHLNLHFWPEFTLITLLVIALDMFPIKLPSGVNYNSGVIGVMYLLFQYGLPPAVFAILVSTLVVFIRLSHGIKQINWFRVFSTIGMYFFGCFISFLLIRELHTVPLPILAFLAVAALEVTNMLLHIGIWVSLGQARFLTMLQSRVKELVFPILITSIVLSRLLVVHAFQTLLFELVYTGFFMVLVILFSGEFLKQIAFRDRKLDESNQHYKSLFDFNPDFVCTLDLDLHIQSLNKASETISGYTTQELLKQPFSILLDSEHYDTFNSHIATTLAEGVPNNFDYHILTKSGRRVDLNITTSPAVVGGNIVSIYLVGKDVTERKESERLIHEMAYFDSLTKLGNRRMFQKCGQAAISEAHTREERVGLILLDLNRFKFINDTLGHTYGDELLELFAERLKGTLSEGEVVSRMGGDEFTILLTGIKTVEEAGETAQRIVAALEKPMYLNHREFHVTASMGISMYPDDGLDMETLVQAADIAMYQAKSMGMTTFCYYSADMLQASSVPLEMENDLRRAIEMDEFQLYYQPILNLGTSQYDEVEALIRWNHPKKGFVQPLEFIPLAEQTGMIVPIGNWVLRSACKQLVDWMGAGIPPVRMAVNISVRHFQHPDFVQYVAAALEESQLDPCWLELEITESVLVDDMNKAIQKIEQLRSMGLQISVDDFGTGYSWLSHIKSLPVDRLKIDRSFVADIETDSASAHIISTIIHLADGLNIEVTTEGVERRQQYEFLKSHRCHRIQGFLLSTPVPADTVRTLIGQNQIQFTG